MKKQILKKLSITVIGIILITALTFLIFNLRQNYLYAMRDRISVFAYQTNIQGSDATVWGENLTNRFSREVEVGVFVREEAGNEQIKISGEDGWQQIVTRLAAKQGDILLVNNKVYYETLLANGYIEELDYHGVFEVCDEDGRTFGIDLTDVSFEELVNTGNSNYVAFGQPLPIKSIDNEGYNGRAPRVIAVVYKGSKHVSEAKSILLTLAKEAENAY